MANEPARNPFRVLCLDGGGSKGVYTIGVLKEVEAVCGRPPCEVFHLIYGASTGAIIAALLALGKRVSEIEEYYISLIPSVMGRCSRKARSAALREHIEQVFGNQAFTAFKTPIGIVTANCHDERPMIFKSHIQQAHSTTATFKAGFGCTTADAVLATSAAYPLFEKVRRRHRVTCRIDDIFGPGGGSGISASLKSDHRRRPLAPVLAQAQSSRATPLPASCQ